MEITQSRRIAGVELTPLKQLPDERGCLLHMLRCDAEQFRQFGEIYFSESIPGVIKGWKKHQKMTQLYAVPVGKIQLVIADLREDSLSYGVVDEIILGRPDYYQLVCIPPNLWYAFKNIGQNNSLIANCSDLPHDPNESMNLPLDTDKIAYQWNV